MALDSDHEKLALIRTVTRWKSPALLPELHLRLVDERSPWWVKTPEELAQEGIPEPFWAFAWGGGQALARYILDHPAELRGRTVVDFGAGGGLLSLAALLAGAQDVIATEIDPWAILACHENLAAYPGQVQLALEDWIDRPLAPNTLLLCGDMSYEQALCDRLIHWFRNLKGVEILIGDPGRGFLPREALKKIAGYQVPADMDSNGVFFREGEVFRWVGP